MNAVERLAGEIERVVQLRSLYRSLGPAGFAAAGLMTISIEKAKRAAGSNDAVEVLAAIKDLEGFTE